MRSERARAAGHRGGALEAKGATPAPILAAVLAVMDTVGDAWSWLILREAILHRVDQFNEFQRALGIARSTLTRRLEHLQAGGILHRHARAHGEAIRYEVTSRGEDFFVCLATRLRWGDEWCADQGPTPLVATHRACGESFHGILRCDACSASIDAADVGLLSAPLVAVEPTAPSGRRSLDLSLLERMRPCSIARALKITGDRWSSLIFGECLLGTRRFDHFAARLGIATSVLSNRLQRLVALGVLRKAPYQNNPPRYEYRLTAKGRALDQVALAMIVWGDRWLHAGNESARLFHRICEQPLRPVLVCDHCRQPVDRSDVDFGLA